MIGAVRTGSFLRRGISGRNGEEVLINMEELGRGQLRRSQRVHSDPAEPAEWFQGLFEPLDTWAHVCCEKSVNPPAATRRIPKPAVEFPFRAFRIQRAQTGVQ